MSSSQTAMQNLTAQWYNALTTSLHLSPQQFQLVQGNVALGSTTSTLWALMDSIPPDSVTQYWTPQGYKSFSSQYGAVIPRIKDPSYGQFQASMGDYFTSWMTYLKTTPPPAGTTIAAYFQTWAYLNMAPDQAGTCVSLFNAAMNGPVAQANGAWTAAGGATGIKAYNQTIETVDNTLATAPSAGITLDSTTESTDTSHTWASGSVEGFWDVFFGEGGSSYEATTSEVTESGLEFSIQYTHLTTIPIVPLQQGTIFAGPNTYQPWYVPAAISEAYENNNFDVWQPGSPDWASFFGAAGSLPRAATALVVVDGITVSCTSKQAIATSSQQEVQTSFEAGFFPFFGVSGSGGWTSSQTFNDSGQIEATASCAVGSPQVLGVLQSAIAPLLAAAQMQAALRGARPADAAVGSLPTEISSLVRLPGSESHVS